MAQPSPRSPLIETVVAVGAAAVLILGLRLSWFGQRPELRAEMLPGFFLYAPLLAIYLTDRDYKKLGYGKGAPPLAGKDLKIFFLAVLPVFLAGYFLYMRFYVGRIGTFFFPWGFPGMLVWHLAGVALPEELFFRGFLQERLNRLLPPRFDLWSVKVGPGLFLAAALFAAAHYLMVPRLEKLLVFFPGLLFGIMRERSGSIRGPILAHGLGNVAFVIFQNWMNWMPY